MAIHTMEEAPISPVLGFLRGHLLLVGIASVGLVFLSIGIYLILPKGDEEVITFEQAGISSQPSRGITVAEKGIVIDVSGAVNHPGVYTLPKDSRVKDAIQAAGGLRDDANQESISKNVNLAQILTDGIKIYLPFQGEEAADFGGSVAGAATKVVHLNTASLSELDSLPKVGAVTAQKIIDNRPYTDIKDLLTKKVVGNAVYSGIESMIAP